MVDTVREVGEMSSGVERKDTSFPSGIPGAVVKVSASRFFLIFLSLAVLGYFLDLECVVNQCDKYCASCYSQAECECVNPTVLPEHQPVCCPALQAAVETFITASTQVELPKLISGEARIAVPICAVLLSVCHARRGPPHLEFVS